jgi:hypothetical protein
MGKKLTTEEFTAKAVEKYGSLYDYTKVMYNGTRVPVTIICPVHGEFQQTPQVHFLSKIGCPKCAESTPPHNKLTTDKFITNAKAIHGDKYDYSKTIYTCAMSFVTIICPVHGEFQQRPNDHVNNKCGCWSCSATSPLTTTQFIQNLKTRFPSTTCGFSNVEYVNQSTPVTITCPVHGNFIIEPKSAYQRSPGLCSYCNYNLRAKTSRGENELVEFLRSLNVDTIQSDRRIISPLELDIVLPDFNIAIEYCGLYWHSEQSGKNKHYHKTKHDMCQQQGIQLLTIFEDEWFTRQQQVKNKIKHMVGQLNKQRVYARTTTIVDVPNAEKVAFFDENHIQQTGPGSVTYGLWFCDEIVAVMSFINNGNGKYVLSRYATKYHVIGGFSKLLKHFQRNNQWINITSFADCRWSNGELYHKTGWRLVKTIPPDYYYSPDGKHRRHKFNYRHSTLPNLIEQYDPNKTERENCDRAGLLRVWDCGKLKFDITNQETSFI